MFFTVLVNVCVCMTFAWLACVYHGVYVEVRGNCWELVLLPLWSPGRDGTQIIRQAGLSVETSHQPEPGVS